MSPSDFQAEVERLRAAGRLPALGEILEEVADVRKKYGAKILKAGDRNAVSLNESGQMK